MIKFSLYANLRKINFRIIHMYQNRELTFNEIISSTVGLNDSKLFGYRLIMNPVFKMTVNITDAIENLRKRPVIKF